MRAPLKRQPVDRARHAKRLESDDGIISLTTPTEATTITTLVSDSPRVIVFTTVSDTPTSTSASMTSASTLQALTATPAPEDRASSIPPAQPTMAPSNSSPKVASKSMLSSGAITGIALAVTLLLAISVFLVRRKIVGMRNKKTTTWGGNMYPKFKQHTTIEKSAVGAPYAFRHEAASSFAPDLPRPQTSYNNPAPTSHNNPASYAKSDTPTISTKPDRASVGRTATVRCTFIPSLPDELSISNGEIVRIVSEYDDGWALCANTRDEQGMVPLECLQKATTVVPESTGGVDWRNAQRASSLASPGSRRY